MMNEIMLIYDDRYTWCGGCGAVFKSKENEVVKGTVRLIAGELFHAYSVYKGKLFSPDEICWCFVDEGKNSPTYLKEFKTKVFVN